MSDCYCDRNNIGVPGVSCGDCPERDYKMVKTKSVMKHTPGPWYAQSTDNLYFDAENVVCTLGDGHYVEAYNEPTYESMEADARLIALAPDMLNALRALLEDGDTNATAVLLAEQAIAKVKGETE